MDAEIFPEDFSKNEQENKEPPKKFESKLSFSVIRLIFCAIILLALSLFKYFDLQIYRDIGQWYALNFKAEKVNSDDLKEFAKRKISAIQKIVKDKIDSL